MLRRLLYDTSGATAVESAVALPVLLAFGVGLSEVGWAAWVQNTLQFATEAAARCAAIDSIRCDTAAEVQAYAVEQSQSIGVATTNFTLTTETCGKQVAASYAFTGGIPGFGNFAPNITAKACHPT